MELFSFGDSTRNKFKTCYGPAKVTYSLSDNKLTVNVDGVLEDDVDSHALLLFLQMEGVLENASEWKIESIQDTDGFTWLDETYTCLTYTK